MEDLKTESVVKGLWRTIVNRTKINYRTILDTLHYALHHKLQVYPPLRKQKGNYIRKGLLEGKKKKMCLRKKKYLHSKWKPIFNLPISGKRILDPCIFSITTEITDCSIKKKSLLICTKGTPWVCFQLKILESSYKRWYTGEKKYMPWIVHV